MKRHWGYNCEITRIWVWSLSTHIKAREARRPTRPAAEGEPGGRERQEDPGVTGRAPSKKNGKIKQKKRQAVEEGMQG